MTRLSRGDLRALRAEAIAGTLFAPPQVLALLDEIDRLTAHIGSLQSELDGRELVAQFDRRSEPRERVAAQTLDNLEVFTKKVTKTEGA